MASLNPAMTVGAQIAETLTLHRGLRGPGARRARAGALAPGAHQRPRAPRARLSAPDERWHPPAGGRRHRHLLPAEPADRRRADDLAGRDDPGPVPEAAEGHPARDEPGAGLRHPRSRHRGQAVRSGGRHVRGPDRGDGDHAGDLQPAPSPLHDRSAELPAHAAPRPRAVDRHRRPAAGPGRRPGRLRVRAALRAGRGSLQPRPDRRWSRRVPEHLVACLRADETPTLMPRQATVTVSAPAVSVSAPVAAPAPAGDVVLRGPRAHQALPGGARQPSLAGRSAP